MLLVVSLAFTGVILLAPSVQAATWTQTSDTDFAAGTLNGVEVVGTGVAASVKLVQDATDWRDENPSGPPSAREGPAMAYDSTNGVVVLFGGYDGNNLGDTWEYTPGTNSWAQISPPSAPSPREFAGMAFDSANGVIVLFGGVSDVGFEADTWEYNAAANTWTETTPATSPGQMGSYHLTFHSGVSRSVFVGLDLSSNFMQTWAYDAAADTWSNRAPTVHPPARTSQAIAYHADLGRIVLFGGSFLFTTFGDTWEYDYNGNSWTETTPTPPNPTARAAHALSYRDSISSVWLFGGNTGSPASDTWRYYDDFGTRRWVPVITQRNPPARHTFGFTDEATGGKSILFGGILNGGFRAGDTWSIGPAYRTFGTFQSSVFDSGGANVLWDTFAWNPASQPAQTVLEFRVATSNDPAGPWTYLGDNCQPTDYYTDPAPTAICGSQDSARYMRVEGRFSTTDNLNTPTLDDFTVVYDVAPVAPYIVFTDPANAQIGTVLLAQSIFVRFSEEILAGSVTYGISPLVSVTESWTEGNSALTLDPVGLLTECTAYTVTILTAQDLDGNPLNNGANLVPNPWSFSTICVPPQITATSPTQGQIDVLLTAPIVIDFSEAMNTGSVNVTITPSHNVTRTWSNGDTRLTLTHTEDFHQCEMHMVEVTGRDLVGNDLLPGPAPNPWDFMTICTIPFIVSTSPTHLQTGVTTTATIVVNFSEPMQPATVTVDIQPFLVLSPSWSNGDRTVTYTHGVPFSTCTTYRVNITGGKDVDGNDLFPGQHEMHAPNPWQFFTLCPNPTVVLTVPGDGDTGVDQFATILVQFSEPMNAASVVATITPSITLTKNWNASNQILTLTHPGEPFGCGPNTVQITGNDVDGNPLVPGPAPNPWNFTPSCPEPFIVTTTPVNDAVGVTLLADVVVEFSEAMNPASVSWVFTPTITIDSFAWTGGNTIVTLSHTALFEQNRQYTVLVSGQDVDGNSLVTGPVPNPWRFTTVGVNPIITQTDPVDGATNVDTTANVIIDFNEPMNTGSVSATPTPFIPFATVWTNGNQTLTLSHLPPFLECTVYSIQVVGNDEAGDPLVPGPVPNPFDFSTVCFAPQILDTNPADGAVDVPLNQFIWVNFSEPMNIASVNALIVPSVPGQASSWSNGDRTLMVSHGGFTECTAYTVTVTGRDLDGNNLIPGTAPNPWTFTAFCPDPFIVSTVPADGAQNVGTSAPIVITFSHGMDRVTVTASFSPGATVSQSWSPDDTVLTLTPNPALTECTTYTVTVAGQDKAGKSLVTGPVPNPWSFDTICTVGAPRNLQITKAPPFLRLTWSPVLSADLYRIYSSTDRFAAFPWGVVGTTTGTTFDVPTHLGDGLTHFYIVRAERAGVEGGNSTMAVKIEKTIGAANPSGSSIWYVALPFRSEYTRASDISNDPAVGPNVDIIAKWDAASQASLVWYKFRGTWRGVDFPLAAGDAVALQSSSPAPFPWVIIGTDRAVTLSFAFNNPPLGNVNWVSVPYTGTYTRASDLVRDIEGSTGPGANTRIVEVGLWDGATQTLLRFFYQAGVGWIGVDFTIAPGDAVYFTIVASFGWQPDLVTPEVP